MLDFDFESSLSRLIPAGTHDARERIQRVLEQKDLLEAGLIDPESYARRSLALLQSDASFEQFYQAWQEIFTLNQPMWQCVQKLADLGHTLILISNINAIHCPWIFSAYPGFSLFTHRVLSFEVGALKPESAIYQYAIDTYRLDPESIAYIDDQPQNIAAGIKLGFQCWQYDLHNHRAFEQWLERFITISPTP